MTVFYSIFIGIILTNPPALNAQSVIFSDNFNDNNIDDWTVVRNRQSGNHNLPCMNNGQPTTWYASEGKVKMEIVNSPSCLTEIVPSNLDLSDIINYSYEFDMILPETTFSDRNLIFIWQDENNWYDIKLFGNSIIIQKVVDGRVRYLQNASSHYFFSPNGSYKFKIVIDNNVISVFIEGQLVLNVNDTEPFITGFKTLGLQASTGAVTTSKVHFDNIIVKSLDETPEQLPVPSLKQTDPHWSNIEYDSGLTWSPDKAWIKDWGCALTSMVMIMKYHGIHLMPDGSNLDPASLNAWLKSQSDGYLYGGLINWFAVGRLTKLLSATNNTPKLEYSRINGSTYDTAITDITNNKPVMLELPGHFVVGTGILDNDLQINDPYYNYDTFSQHNKPLLSTRSFQPSQTDLSGFVISSSNNASITLFRNDQQVTGATQSAEFITEPEQNGQSPTVHVLEYSKPIAGDYTVTLQTATPFERYSLHLHLYNTDGSVVSKVAEMISGPDGQNTFDFIYDSESVLTVKQMSTFELLNTHLESLFASDHIYKKFAVFSLSKYLLLAHHSPVTEQLRWTVFIKDVVTNHTNLYSDTAKNYLIQELTAIKTNLEEL